jgi:hypothetical protein
VGLVGSSWLGAGADCSAECRFHSTGPTLSATVGTVSQSTVRTQPFPTLTSFLYTLSVCIDPARNQCALPLNIGDDHLGPGCVAESIDKYTVSQPNLCLNQRSLVAHPASFTVQDVSLQIFKIEFLQLEGEILAESALGLTEEAAFEQVLRMDLRLLEVQERLPAYFRDPADLPPGTSSMVSRLDPASAPHRARN